MSLQDLRDQQAELSIAQHGDRTRLPEFTWSRISQAAARGSTNTACSVGSPGTRLQSSRRAESGIAKGSGMFHDAEHGAIGAMASEAARAPVAMSAGQIDFAHDALADPC